ncbi:ATP-dependent RecD-like DNA helicase [Gammaproteobacteria bacterium]|nr:ATP-dependent RecD-like DNA helicase [Gammaproteobacteria bacterium]
MDEKTLEGTCEKIIFHNEENGYTVFKIKDHESQIHTCTGSSPLIQEKSILHLSGNLVDGKYGPQLQCSIITPVLPKTKNQIIRYLSSGVITGIGEGFAKKLVDFAGINIFEKLDQDPKSFYQIKGVGEKRIAMLLSHWQAHRHCHEVMLFLQRFGIGPKRANKIYQTYQSETMQVLCEDPYRIYHDIHGIGFKIADQIALESGIAVDDHKRLIACCIYVLEQASQAGHCLLPIINMPSRIEGHIDHQITHETLLNVVNSDKNFELVDDNLYLRSIYQAESELKSSISQLSTSSSVWPNFIRHLSLNDLKCSGHSLSTTQQDAVRKVLNSPISIVTGGPGVGKTTITQAIIQLAKEANLNILLCAPTGRAAKKLASCTQYEAKTIHRLLKMDPATRKFKHHIRNPLPADLILIDECSMIDIFLARHLFQAISTHSNVILVGDIDQLPSVGPGAFLQDMIQRFSDHTAYLTQIYRQAQDSAIIKNAHRINQGKSLLPNESDVLSDFYFIAEQDPLKIHKKVLELVSERIPKRFSLNPLDDIQILAPMHKGSLGTQVFNQLLQDQLNKTTSEKTGQFKVGDKVIQTKNNYDKDVFNGDIGYIREISSTRKEVTVDFGDHFVAYLFSELDELQLAYAISIHKSQGSEYPAVIIPLGMQHFTLLERNLIYTAMTRGRKLVIIIGDLKALYMAIRNAKSKLRYTSLANLN